jgi:hypothetical protein
MVSHLSSKFGSPKTGDNSYRINESSNLSNLNDKNLRGV